MSAMSLRIASDSAAVSSKPGSMIDVQLLRFLEIDDETRTYAAHLWQIVEPKLPMVIEVFYGKVRRTLYGEALSDEVIARLKEAQRKHWTMLFTSDFSEDYLNSVRRVGLRHRDISLDPTWYVAAYMALKIEFVNIIVRSDHSVITKGHLIRTLDRYFAIDMGIALSTYMAAVLD